MFCVFKSPNVKRLSLNVMRLSLNITRLSLKYSHEQSFNSTLGLLPLLLCSSLWISGIMALSVPFPYSTLFCSPILYIDTMFTKHHQLTSLFTTLFTITTNMKESPSKKGRKKDSIEQFISSPQLFLENGLSQLRYMVLIEGLSTPPGYEQCPYRSYVWSILCRVATFPTDRYLKLIEQAPNTLGVDIYNKIKNDTFRTLMNDKAFHLKVSEESLIRILSGIAITTANKVGYVQGLNVLLAPIAYTCHKSEPQAYSLLHNLITKHIPLYITPNLDGVHTGLSLVDVVLKIIDPILSEYLDSKFLKAEIYAFPSVLTLCACTPPLKSVLKLWDFLFAYGTHMNILFVVAQLIINRSQLLNSSQPMKILRNFPQLEDSEIIKLSLSFIPELPKELYDLISRHGYDKDVPGELKVFLID